MSKTKQWQEGKEYYCDGKRVRLLQDYNYQLFMAAEEADWNELKTFLSNQAYVVCCSEVGFDNFLNNVIMTGNTSEFIEALDKISREYPRTTYHLTNNGRTINTATIV